MTRVESLKNILPIIFPKFYTLFTPDMHELVFLDCGERLKATSKDKDTGILISKYLDSDKTQCEAVQNHIHIFRKINPKDVDNVTQIGMSIANNLIDNLKYHFPKKKFIVYLEVNAKDTTIIRFHQVWENEPQYFDIKSFKYKNVEIYEFTVN